MPRGPTLVVGYDGSPVARNAVDDALVVVPATDE